MQSTEGETKKNETIIWLGVSPSPKVACLAFPRFIFQRIPERRKEEGNPKLGQQSTMLKWGFEPWTISFPQAAILGCPHSSACWARAAHSNPWAVVMVFGGPPAETTLPWPSVPAVLESPQGGTERVCRGDQLHRWNASHRKT